MSVGMGAKVQFDNYYTMRDLNHDSNGSSWHLHHGENNLPNGQYNYHILPRPTPDMSTEIDKELLKQKMLEHEAVFRSQVFELHRLYRVQKDLMDEMRKQEHCNHRTNFETSSSSSPFPSQRTRVEAHRRNSSSFLFKNGVCGAPPVIDLKNVRLSADGSQKGKSAQCGPMQSQNYASPRNSEASESRPSKVRKMIDLQLPADENTDTDEVEQCGHGMTNDSRCENTKSALADLNEPLEPEVTNCFQNGDLVTTAPGLPEVVTWKQEHGNIDGTQKNSHCNEKGNGQNWFLSVPKAEGSKDNGKSYHHINNSEKAPLLLRSEQVVFENQHQPPGFFPPHHGKEDLWSARANGRFEMFDKSRSLSGYNNLEGIMTSHLPSNVPYSNLVNSWDNCWRRPSNFLNHTSTSTQMTSFLDSADLPKSSQSTVHGNGFLEAWWSRNDKPRANPGFGSEAPVKNGFYHGSSSGVYKDLHASFSKAGPDYVNRIYNERAASASSTLVTGIDLNSTRELNLNVPDCLSNELFAKGEDSVSVLPWLRDEASKTEAAKLQNGFNRPGPSSFHNQHELQNGCEIRRVLDHQNSVASSSCNVDAAREKLTSPKKILEVPIFKANLSEDRVKESEKKKVLFDINVACDDPEESHIDDDKIGTPHPNGLRNMIDLNTCVMEDEVISFASHTNSNSSLSTNTMKKPKRGILIDLEAPVNLDDDDDEDDVICLADEQLPLQDSTDSSHETLARLAAEAIVDISTPATLPQPSHETSASENTLHWFADIACISPDNAMDCESRESDYFEEMTLKLTESSVEEYFPNPPNFDSLAVDEPGPINATGRARRGPARRGRQRRDFQRDILPGLTSLARNEVTEDLQTFGGLMRATGHTWQCGTRRSSSRGGFGRGRRKAVVAVAPPPPPPPLPPPPPPVASYPTVNATVFSPNKNGEIMLEDRSLTSWGKTTRRPRRQRCPPAPADC
ncbi:hypothetical protein V2J09_015357 [Rumex salicifolius]